jgi:PilZ domain
VVVVGKFRDQAELRRYRRQLLRYGASILVDQRGTTRPCSISDISESGARLLLEHDAELPEKFILLLTPKGDARRICRLVWRDGNVLGVSFLHRSYLEAG